MLPLRYILALLVVAISSIPVLAQKEYGFDNRKPSGQPYLKPEESVSRMKVPDGFEVKLFAAEPMIVNPIAMTVDEKGRVWCIECFEYPKRTAKGKMPRDRIVILEDTDGDGIADKRTVFCEGKDFPEAFDLASGLEVGNGGVYVGAPPCLWFIENKGDKPGKFTKLLSGFGSEDTHEMLNTFQWGPDGRLYGLHGVFTHSNVKPTQADGPETRLNAGVWRYDTRTKQFEVFAEGTSNPWGMDWRNTDGQFILCCCVIPHLFHMSPGGIYKRQAGQSFNPSLKEAEYIKEICDHTFHKESGWAHAGLISLDTPIMPKEYRESVIFGSIHGCSIKRNVLRKNGSTYTASRADDFLVSGDKNFRPINLRWGPNGEIYCSDWHDQNPCHQAAPDSWDYEHGRVFRIQPKGLKTKKAEDLGKKSEEEWVKLLKDDNPYVYRTALRLLTERRTLKPETGLALAQSIRDGDLHARFAMNALAETGEKLEELSINKVPELRVWDVRSVAESPRSGPKSIDGLAKLAAKETEPIVRRELASAAIRLGVRVDTAPLLHALMTHKEDAKDALIAQLVWLAFEKKLQSPAQTELDWLRDNAAGNALVSDTIIPRAMRRLATLGKKEDLDACVAFVASLKDSGLRKLALAGLAEGMQTRQVEEPAGWKMAKVELLKDGDGEVQRLVRHLSINFQDVVAIRRALAVASDAKKPVAERVEAVRDLALARPVDALKALQELLARDASAEVRVEACRALSGYDNPEAIKSMPGIVLAGWKEYPPELRIEAVNLLAGRKEYAGPLLSAVGDKKIARTDLNDNTILRIRALKDQNLNVQIEKVWGTFRDTPAELNALIDKLRGQINEGRPSFANGQKVFEHTCAKCHKFEGKGHEVGPQLDGSARDIEYLLVNVIDPNRVVGQPYFTRIVHLKNGRVETGLLAAEDEGSVTLKSENDAQKTIQKKDIEEIIVSQKSVMPEGLTNNLKPAEFRDLVRYLMANPFLTQVRITGPLDPKDSRFQDMRNVIRDAGLQRDTPSVGVHGRIPLPVTKGETEAISYIEAEVTAPVALKTKLLLGAGVPIQAWVNGKLVYDGKPGDGHDPDQAGADVELREGTNQIVLKATFKGGKEGVFARLLDPSRRLRYPEP
jgi:putative membrane-bound dehydrogenase-like protein